jgi:hypothetical protein
MRTDGHDEADSRFLQFCERTLQPRGSQPPESERIPARIVTFS